MMTICDTAGARAHMHSLATVIFKGKENDLHLVVGTVKDMKLAPRSFSAAFIHVYRFVHNHTALEMVHKTQVNDVPLALTAFQNRLLAGVGKSLRIYDLGKRKLLRKCENKTFPTTIATLQVQGERIFVGDMCEAFFYVRYKPAERQLLVAADSLAPRYVTASAVLDYDTVAGADKFGNVFISRLPQDAGSGANGTSALPCHTRPTACTSTKRLALTPECVGVSVAAVWMLCVVLLWCQMTGRDS
jgi:hypothetical protein